MIDLGKCLVVAFGEASAVQLEDDLKLSLDASKFAVSRCVADETKLLKFLMDYDVNADYSDIIFVCSDVEASEAFLSYKYDEKVLLKEIADPRPIHAESATWVSFDDLPSLIERLERNFSGHANF